MKSGGRVMIKKICRLISCLPLSACILFLCSLTASNSFALDPPHNISNNITCATTCHQTAAAWKTGPTGTPTIDNTYTNNMCKFCHLPGGNGYTMTEESQDVQTHSSVKTSTTYGNWTMEYHTHGKRDHGLPPLPQPPLSNTVVRVSDLDPEQHRDRDCKER